MFRTVVVGTDGSPRAGRALQEAIDVARTQGARLHIVAAFSHSQAFLEPVQSSAKVSGASLRDAAEQVLMRAAKSAEEQGVKTDWAAHEGDPADVILDAAADQDADLIVVGNKGVTGARRYMLGSVPNKVGHHAGCSVLVVRTD